MTNLCKSRCFGSLLVWSIQVYVKKIPQCAQEWKIPINSPQAQIIQCWEEGRKKQKTNKNHKTSGTACYQIKSGNVWPYCVVLCFQAYQAQLWRVDELGLFYSSHQVDRELIWTFKYSGVKYGAVLRSSHSVSESCEEQTSVNENKVVAISLEWCERLIEL